MTPFQEAMVIAWCLIMSGVAFYNLYLLRKLYDWVMRPIKDALFQNSTPKDPK